MTKDTSIMGQGLVQPRRFWYSILGTHVILEPDELDDNMQGDYWLFVPLLCSIACA